MLNRRKFGVGIGVTGLGSGLIGIARSSYAADDYPNKVVRLVVGFPAGGIVDLLARMLAENLQSRLGQPVIVDNRPGAGTVIGSDHVAKQAPDGYTLLLTSPSLASAQFTMRNVPYDPLKDFTSICPLGITQMVLSASPNLPANNMTELVSLLKAKPNVYKYASYGTASANNLFMMTFNQALGLDTLHVPYKGAPLMIADLMRGDVNLIFDALQQSFPFIQSGQIKALAIANSKRAPAMPNLPTIAETVLPGFALDPWFGLSGPAGTPVNIVNRLNREVNAILANPDFRKRMEGAFIAPGGGTPQDLQALVQGSVQEYGAATKRAGIKPE